MKTQKKDYSDYLQQKPYKEWSKNDIYYGMMRYRREKGLPKLSRAHYIPSLAPKDMKQEFLRMVGAKDGQDIYAMNLKVIAELDDEKLDLIWARYQAKADQKPRPARYVMEYIAVWEDRYDVVQEEVDIIKGRWFKSSIDGTTHDIKERGAKIVEVIYNR